MVSLRAASQRHLMACSTAHLRYHSPKNAHCRSESMPEGFLAEAWSWKPATLSIMARSSGSRARTRLKALYFLQSQHSSLVGQNANSHSHHQAVRRVTAKPASSDVTPADWIAFVCIHASMTPAAVQQGNTQAAYLPEYTVHMVYSCMALA